MLVHLYKARNITSLSLEQINSFTKNDCARLVEEISKVVDKKLNSSCTIKSISHSVEIKVSIKNETANVKLKQREIPGTSLRRREEPADLHSFTYDQLKAVAKKKGDTYQGLLYGSVKNHICDVQIGCPSCNASGVCSECHGEKQVICPVCNGNKECVSCNGTGRYQCENCGGDGDCPECDEGWVTCDECNGNGEIICPDCNGTGNYIDEPCNKCNGSGYYYDKVCRTCGGSGRFVRECARCKGSGEIECDECYGKGGWKCEECHGTGKCSHCHGRGDFKCKACNGSGKCGKCHGKGKIWCPKCEGKGICFNCKGEKMIECPRCKGTGEYQTYEEYSFKESTNLKYHCSILGISDNDIKTIKGDISYRGVIYNFFAKKANIHDIDTFKNGLSESHIKLLRNWIALERNFPSDTISFRINDNYLNTFIEVFKIPMTKVVLQCNSTEHPIYIVGIDKTIFYEHLPNKFECVIGKIRNLIGKRK